MNLVNASESDPLETVSQGPPVNNPEDPDALTVSQHSVTPIIAKVRTASCNPPAPPGYSIQDEVGRGGMGVVYEATDTRLKRPVALKMLLSGLDGPHLIRFLIEAESMAQVRHPNVVQVFEAGEYLGRPFLAMEFLAGGTLSARLKTRPKYPIKEAVALMVQIARGVEAAHRQGIVHRDLKPGNIMFDAAEQPRVTDFGLAKRNDQDLTATEQTMGTPAYMAPEQALGKTKSAGASADVYSLGVMLFELLTGQRPFNGDNPASLIYKVIHEPAPTIKSIDAGLPRDLEVIIDKCLEKDARKRYLDAGLLADDLERYLRDEPISARPAGSVEKSIKWMRRHPAITLIFSVVVISVLVIGIGGSVLLRRTDDARKVALEALAQTTKAREELQAKLDEASEILDANSVVQIQEVFKNGASPAKCLELLQKIPRDHLNIEWGLTAKSLDQSLFRLYGHHGPLTVITYFNDSSRIVTGSTDGMVMFWEAATGRLLNSIEIGDEIKRIDVSADRSIVVAAGQNGKVLVLDPLNHQPIDVLKIASSSICGLAISPDSKSVLIGTADQGVQLWKLGEKATKQAIEKSSTELISMVADARWKMIATSDLNGLIRLYDGKTNQLIKEIHPESPHAVSLAISSNGKRLMSGPISASKASKAADLETAHVWDLETFKELGVIREPRERIESFTISGNGLRAVIGSGNSARIWNLKTADSIGKIRGHNSDVTAVAISYDGQFAATGSVDNSVRVWNGESEHARPELREHRGAIFSVAISKDGKRVLTGSEDNTARVWDAISFKRLFTLEGHRGAINSVEISFDGERFVTGSDDKTVRVWDARTGKCLRILEDHQGVVHDVALSPDGKRVLIANGERSAGLYEVETGKALFELSGHTDFVTCVAYSTQGDRIVTGSADRSVRIWDAKTGSLVHKLLGHRGEVSCVAISANGGWIVSGSKGSNKESDNTVRVWDALSGEQKFEIRGHAGTVSDVAISRDGKRIIIASDDKTARVLDSRTGQVLFILRGHTQGVTSVAISSDGQRLVTGSEDTTVNVWDARVQTETKAPFQHMSHVTDVYVSQDQRLIATGCENGDIMIWNSSTGESLGRIAGADRAVSRVWLSADNARITARLIDGTIRDWDLASLQLIHKRIDTKPPTPSRWFQNRQIFIIPNGSSLSFIDKSQIDVDAEEQDRRRRLTQR